MKRSMKAKMIFSYLAVALITVLVVSVLIRVTSGQSLMNMVVQQQTAALSNEVKNYYNEVGSLDGFSEYFFISSVFERMNPQPIPHDEKEGFTDMRGVEGLVDENNKALIPTKGIAVGQVVNKDLLKDAVPVKVEGKTIAYILPDTKFQFALSAEETIFIKRTNLAIALAALAGVLVAVVMGFLLAGNLIKPIRRLTRASEALAKGALEQQVPVTSQDELGQLTASFNQMSADLFKADQERKRLTADITHDLSTPLTVIAGYIEMLEDGTVEMTPQRIEIIKTEIEHLRRLVGDLTTLTQVEAGGLDMQLQPTDPGALLKSVYNTYQLIVAQKQVNLVLDLPETLPLVNVDEGRMLQVIKNLVENALRYTPVGGEVCLSARVNEGIQLSVQDNGEGIDAEDLPYVFERFFRADKTRGANSGKMGLGLAICKALVNAQGGKITAYSEGRGKGSTFTISLQPAVSPKV